MITRLVTALAVPLLLLGVVSATSANAAVAPSSGTWSAPTPIDHPQGQLDAISCTAPTACVAADEQGYVYRLSGGKWTATPDVVGAAAEAISCRGDLCALAAGSGIYESQGSGWQHALSTPVGMRDVSCGSDETCLAVDYEGQVAQRTSDGWTPPSVAIPGYRAFAVGCASPTFCAASFTLPKHPFRGYVSTWDGSTWAPPVYTNRTVVDHMSCTAGGFCMAADSIGRYLTYRNGAWSDRKALRFNLGDLSCRATTCMTVDSVNARNSYDANAAARYANGRWTELHPRGNVDGMTAVSCATTKRCEGVAASGYVRAYEKGKWLGRRYVVQVTGNLENLSCASSTFCAADDTAGNVLVYNGSTWSKPTLLAHELSSAPKLSCGSPSFCIATHRSDTWRWNGRTWSKLASQIDAPTGLLSCAKGGFCLAVATSGGNLSVFRRGAWHALSTSLGLDAVSCASATFCVGETTNYERWNGTSWHRMIGQPQQEGPFLYLSCSSTSFCMATDSYGHWQAYRAPQWKATHQRPDQAGLYHVSCASRSFCEALDGNGNPVNFSGAGWSDEQFADGATAARVSCAGTSFCAAINTTDVMTRS